MLQLRQKEERLRERDTDVLGIVQRVENLLGLEIHAIHQREARLLGGTVVWDRGEVVGPCEATRLLYPSDNSEKAAPADFVHDVRINLLQAILKAARYFYAPRHARGGSENAVALDDAGIKFCYGFR